MRRFFCVMLALLLVALLVLPLAAVEPQHEGIARVTQAVRESVGTDTAGAAVVLFENGKRILYEGYGYANIADRSLVTAETVFELGDLSSLFVALAVQSLAEQGRVETDRDIAYYLPGDFMKKLDLSYAITLNDLLAGRAGFADRYFDLRYTNPALVFDTLEEALLASVPAQNGVPGTSYAFSRFGITLAALVVEYVAETDYATYVSEQILQPLGMTHTYLTPHAQAKTGMAHGHVDKGEGYFAVAESAGLSYSALWPADGAMSNAADLSVLLQYLLADAAHAQILMPVFENGIFQTGMAGLCASGSVRGMRTSTAHYATSLCFDPANARAALVLCNTKESALTQVPLSYCGLLCGNATVVPGDFLPEPSEFEGEYILRGKTSGNLYARTLGNLKIRVGEEGEILWQDMRLVQIAPGIFADENGVAMLQFTTDVEGQVTGVISANGECYRPAKFLEKDAIVNLLFVLLTLGALYFLVAGILALSEAILSRARGVRHPRPWRFTLPWCLAALHALIVLLQIWVCASFGTATIASFLTASATVALFAVIGATCGFVYALFTAFSMRRMTARVARSAAIYVVFLIICSYWDIIFL